MIIAQIKEGTVINDRYEVTGKLGDGGFASVFRARDLELDREVAIKIMKQSVTEDASDRERFRREARTLAQLMHDNIIKCFAVDLTENGFPIIIMEYLKGKTLQTYIRESGPLNWQSCSLIFSQICLALSCAHKQGVLHRDLSSSNIFILDGPELRVKVIDFGIAKALHGEKDKAQSLQLTKTGMVLGNPPYMSPEQCRGHKIDARSDLYSLGCVLYEALCGKAPFEGANPISIMAAHQSDYPMPPEFQWQNQNLEKRAKAIILKCLQKKPEKRFKSAEELLSCFQEPENTETNLHLPTGQTWGRVKSHKPNKKTTLAILISAALIFLAISKNDRVQLLLLKAVISLHSPALIDWQESIADRFQEKSPEKAAIIYEELLSQNDVPQKTIVSITLALGNIYGRTGRQAKIPALLVTALAKTNSSSEWRRTDISKALNLLNTLAKTSSPTSLEIVARSQLLEAALKLGQSSRSFVESMCQYLLNRVSEYVSSKRSEYSVMTQVCRCLTEAFKTFPIKLIDTNLLKILPFARICPREATKMYEALASNPASRKAQTALALTGLVQALTEFDKRSALKVTKELLNKAEAEPDTRAQLLLIASRLCAADGDLTSALRYSKAAERSQKDLYPAYTDFRRVKDVSLLLDAYHQEAQVYERLNKPEQVTEICKRAYSLLPGLKQLEEEEPIPIYGSTSEFIDRKTMRIGDSWITHLIYHKVLSLCDDFDEYRLMENTLTNYKYVLRNYPHNCYIGTRWDFGEDPWHREVKAMSKFCKQLSFKNNLGTGLKHLLEDCAKLCDENMTTN